MRRCASTSLTGGLRSSLHQHGRVQAVEWLWQRRVGKLEHGFDLDSDVQSPRKVAESVVLYGMMV